MRFITESCVKTEEVDFEGKKKSTLIDSGLDLTNLWGRVAFIGWDAFIILISIKSLDDVLGTEQ